MKGRTPPPKRDQSAPIFDQPGLYLLEYRHEDGCKTIQTQRFEDCTCGPLVEQKLRRYQPGGAQ